MTGQVNIAANIPIFEVLFMDTQRIKAYFTRLLPNLSVDTWAAVESTLIHRRFARGETILAAGQTEGYVNYLEQGLVRMYYNQEGKERITAFFREDEMFSGYESFLSQRPMTYTIEAVEDTDLWSISKRDVQAMYDAHPEMDRFGRLIAEYLFIFITDMNHALATMSPEDRYLRMIKNRAAILQRVPQYMIASYLGVTPEALSRIRKRISTQN
jgi:CRP-like cAMP-binding protein